MIKYALHCDNGHAFESWFPDSDAYEKQARRGLVACPACNSTKVAKQIMAPAIASASHAEPAAGPGEVVALGEREKALREMVRELRRRVIANSDDVGDRFPEEARRIHYGESDPRSIRGRATPDEAKALHEEGVEFLPLPGLPDERN